MQVIGVIVGFGSSSFSEVDWIKCADHESELCSYEPVEVRNPATGRTIWASAPKSSKRLIHNGTQIGAFAWSQNEEPLLWVKSDDDWTNETTSFAERLAAKLGGKFTTHYT